MNVKIKIAINTLCILLCLNSLLEQYLGRPIDFLDFIGLSIANSVLLIGNIIECRRRKRLADFLAEKRKTL